jgi:putative two-component system response regulator
LEDTLAHIQAQAGQHFDPALVPLFVALVPQLLEIQQRWAD